MEVKALGDPWTPGRPARARAGGLGARRGAGSVGLPGRDAGRAGAATGASRSTARVSCGPARTGPLQLDAAYDPEVLRHVSILKLAEEEARTLVGEPDESALRSLGVPEVVVTLGSEGSLVLADGKLEQVPAQAAGEVDPTGAGDASRPSYLASRSSGHAPAAAARRATALVAGLLARRSCVRALVRTVDGVFEVDLDEEEVLGPVDVARPPER